MKKKLSLIQLATLITLLLSSYISQADIINVTTTKDELGFFKLHERCLNEIGTCSLREAVHTANETPGNHIINIPAGTYKLTLLGYDEDNNETGDLDIHGPLILQGKNKSNTIIDGIAYDRILHQHDGYLKINNLTLQNGHADNGGAIASQHTANHLHVNHSNIINNFAEQGAAIDYSSSKSKIRTQLFIRDSKIANNLGQSIIYYMNGERLTVERSFIENNTGEAIYSKSQNLLINGSQFTENGSGLYQAAVNAICNRLEGKLVIKNSQFNHNSYTDSAGSIVNLTTGDVATGCTYAIDQSKFIMNKSNSTISAYVTSNTHFDIIDSSFEYNIQSEQEGDKNAITYAVISINGNNVNKNQTVNIENSTVAYNDFTQYGFVSALYARNAQVNVVNSTISTNKGRANTILSDQSTISLQHVTLAKNTSIFANLGGLNGNVGSITLKNTILADENINCFSSNGITSLGHNLDKDGSCELNQTSDIIGLDPLLKPLTINGGLTKTHLPEAISPVINKAKNGIGPKQDQRKSFRPYGPAADIGAVELIYISPIECTPPLVCISEN